MEARKNETLDTFVSVGGTKSGSRVYFSFTAPSVSIAYQAASFLCDRLDTTDTQNTNDDTHMCPIHNVAMTRHTKDGQSWYSHKLDDGTWCRG